MISLRCDTVGQWGFDQGARGNPGLPGSEEKSAVVSWEQL